MSYQPYERNAKSLVFFGDAGGDALFKSDADLKFDDVSNKLIIPSNGYIGSVGNDAAIQIDANGNVTMATGVTITGDLTVNGTTTTVNTTNTVVSDSLIELGNGTTGTPGNDAGLVIERGDADNAFIGFDESTDKFVVGTGTFTGASTGGLTFTAGTLVAGTFEGNLTGNVTGDVTGDLTGNADTATTATTATTANNLATSFITGLTDLGTSIAGTTDLLLVYDASTTSFKSITRDDLVSGLGSMSNFTLAGDTGSDTISQGNTLTVAGGNGIDTSVSADTATVTVNDAYIKGLAGAMVTGNTETLITVTYQSVDNTIDFVVNNDLSAYDNSASQFLTSSTVGSALTAGTGIDITGSTIKVLIDDSTIDWTGSVLKVGDGSIGATQLATGGITFAKLSGSAVQTGTEVGAAGGTIGDNDTSLLTAAAVINFVEGKGYTTNTGDIEGVTAGDGLTGGGTTGTVSLAVNVDNSSLEIATDVVQVKALGVTNAMLAGSIANAKLSNSAITIAGVSTSLGGSITADTIAGAISAGTITNGQLANSSVNFGGVSVSLGSSDTTPAFDLTDATNYPTSSLVGTITNAQLAGSIANSKLVNSSVNYGGVTLSLGGSDTTPAFDLTDATNYPTSSLVGTITNAQLAGSITNAKLVNSSVNFGGVTVSLGASDTTPAFDLSDATNYRFGSLTRVVNSSAITADASVSNDVSLVDSSSATVTMTLPTPSAGLFYTIKKVDSSANTVVVDAGTGSATLDGGANFTLYHQYETVSCVCDGTNWHIV